MWTNTEFKRAKHKCLKETFIKYMSSQGMGLGSWNNWGFALKTDAKKYF